jgi:large subunit ribosomal protein L25
MADKTTTLTVTARQPEGSRSTRRLRRQGQVPGVLYGGGDEPVAFAVDARELRHALHGAGAVLDVQLDGKSTPAVLKDAQRHPLRGETTHVDLLRVDLSKPIQATVAVELLGGDDAPGAKEGGILDQPIREVTVEALPTDIPESIQIDVSELTIGDGITLAAASVPSGVTLLDDPETTVASMLAPRLQSELDELDAIEEETGVVGEGEGEAAPADAGEDAAEGGDDSGDE